MCIFPELREERLALFPDSIGRAFEILPPRRAISGGGQTEVTTGQRVKPRSESRNAPPTLTTTPACGRGSEHFSLLLSSSVDGNDGDGEALAAILDKSQREESSRGRAVVTADRRKAPAASSHLPNSLRRSRFHADLGEQRVFCLSACLPRSKTSYYRDSSPPRA